MTLQKGRKRSIKEVRTAESSNSQPSAAFSTRLRLLHDFIAKSCPSPRQSTSAPERGRIFLEITESQVSLISKLFSLLACPSLSTLNLDSEIVTSRLDEGGLGQVYTVQHRITQKFGALKAEANEVEGGSAIKLEIDVLRVVHAEGEKPHLPVVFHAAKHANYCYMIMTLLGDNFKALKNSQKKEVLSLPTWSRLAIQSLYALKIVHDHGFVHRDIKPNNFVMGFSKDAERARIVHVLDFGLARSYAFKKGGQWQARKARGTAEFRGTLRYCTPNVHDRLEQGRRDDIWSLFYVLIELHVGLPWQKERDKEKIETMKITMSDADLIVNMPRELKDVIPDLCKLNCYSRPDYLGIYKCLLAVMKRYGVKHDDPYDWEKSEPSKYLFFSSDPIGIDKAPEREVSPSHKSKM